MNPDWDANRWLKHKKTLFSERENRGTVEGRLARSTLPGSQNHPCALPLVFQNSTKHCYFGPIAAKKALLWGHMPCITIFMHLQCSNQGILSFPLAKLTIPGGHGLLLAPYFCHFDVQNYIANGSWCYIGDLWWPVVLSGMLCFSTLFAHRRSLAGVLPRM